MKKTVITLIALLTGALHFLIGPAYRGPFHRFCHSYLIDIMLPFTLFLLAGLFRHPLMKKLWLRILLIFFIGASVEILQYFKIPVFGRTFDPADFLMYGLGILLALIFEQLVLSRLPDHK